MAGTPFRHVMRRAGMASSRGPRGHFLTNLSKLLKLLKHVISSINQACFDVFLHTLFQHFSLRPVGALVPSETFKTRVCEGAQTRVSQFRLNPSAQPLGFEILGINDN